MKDYKKLYFELFNGISDIIEDLKSLQMRMEEEIMSCETEETAR